MAAARVSSDCGAYVEQPGPRLASTAWAFAARRRGVTKGSGDCAESTGEELVVD